MAVRTKATSKKTTGEKAPGKKPTGAKSSKKAAKAPAAPSAKAVAITVLKATPSRDGAMWTLSLSNGAKAKVSAAAAQSAGVRVGGGWSSALATRVQSAADDQKVFLRAMEMLAKNGRTSAAALSKLLGGDVRAKRTVAALKKNGWIG